MKKRKPLARNNTTLIIGVSWRKKAAKFPTNVTEARIRNYVL